MIRRSVGVCAVVLVVALTAGVTQATEVPVVNLSLKDHAFVPQELTVPAGQKIKLIVKNEDSTAAEFESYDLNREKIIPAHGEVTIHVDPLDAGTYEMFDDFRRSTVTGKIIAK